MILHVGLELFGLLDHVDNAVVPAGAGGLLDEDDAVALLNDGARVDIAALALADGERFAGDGGLVTMASRRRPCRPSGIMPAVRTEILSPT